MYELYNITNICGGILNDIMSLLDIILFYKTYTVSHTYGFMRISLRFLVYYCIISIHFWLYFV